MGALALDSALAEADRAVRTTIQWSPGPGSSRVSVGWPCPSAGRAAEMTRVDAAAAVVLA